jgi:CarD family transcriptional regulator
MLFDIGQNIVHPAHGAGTIVGIAEQELVTGYSQYYVIEFSDQRMTIHLPVERTEEIGIRSVMTSEKYAMVLETLAKLPRKLPSDYKQRRAEVEEMVNSGAPVEVARALRELTWQQETKPLNNADSRLMSEARSKLVQEIALATDQDATKIHAEIDDALARALAAKLQVVNSEVMH